MGLNKGIKLQESGFKRQESGIRVQGALYSIIDNFTVLLFYFFKKKIYWNIGTFELTSPKSLKYKHKIDLKCSKTS